MAQRLRKLTIDRVDLVDRGANPGARIALSKRNDTAPDVPASTANAGSLAFVAKAIAAYPAEPRAVAIAKFAAAHPDEYSHVSRDTAHGTTRAFTPPRPIAAPMVKRADATTLIMRTAETVRTHLPALSVAQSIDLAARLRPDAYATHAGHAGAITKAGPATERELEQRLVTEYLQTRDALRRAADAKAALAIGQTMAPLISALLNLWAEA